MSNLFKIQDYLSDLKNITYPLVEKYPFDTILSLAGLDSMDYVRSEWENTQNPEPYRFLCLKILRVLTVLQTHSHIDIDGKFWADIFHSSNKSEIQLQCVLAFYGSTNKHAWPTLIDGTRARKGKVKVFALETIGSIGNVVKEKYDDAFTELKSNLVNSNPWNKLGALAGFSIFPNKNSKILQLISFYLQTETDEHLIMPAFTLLCRHTDRTSFSNFVRNYTNHFSFLNERILGHIFLLMSSKDPEEAHRITKEVHLNQNITSPLNVGAAYMLGLDFILRMNKFDGLSALRYIGSEEI